MQKNYDFTSRNPISVAASEEIEGRLRRTLKKAKEELEKATKLNQEGMNNHEFKYIKLNNNSTRSYCFYSSSSSNSYQYYRQI